MKTRNSFPQFVLFVGIGFGPLVLAYGVLVFGLLLNVLIILVSSDTPDLSIGCAILIAALLVFSGVSLTACFRLYNRSNNWLTQIVIFYGCWLLLTAIPAFLLTASIAGVSMSAVDGSIAESDLIKVSIRESLSLLLFLHIGIIPWIMGATWVMGRFKIGQPASS
jgi:hypothetical protein